MSKEEKKNEEALADIDDKLLEKTLRHVIRDLKYLKEADIFFELSSNTNCNSLTRQAIINDSIVLFDSNKETRLKNDCKPLKGKKMETNKKWPEKLEAIQNNVNIMYKRFQMTKDYMNRNNNIFKAKQEDKNKRKEELELARVIQQKEDNEQDNKKIYTAYENITRCVEKIRNGINNSATVQEFFQKGIQIASKTVKITDSQVQ